MKQLRLSALILLFLVTVASSSFAAPAVNTINSVTVAIPACSGFAGRVDINFTIDGIDNFLSTITLNTGTGLGSNVTPLGAGTHTFQHQFIPTFGAPLANGSVVTVTVSLTNVAETVTYDSVTFSFACDTGLPVVPTSPSGSTPPATTNSAANPPDNRINWGYGDLSTVIYSSEDGAVVYCYSNGSAWLAFQINQELVDNWDSSNAQETPLLTIDDEGCHAAFYILDTGEYQINIWSTDGKLYEIIADNLNFANASLHEHDPNDAG